MDLEGTQARVEVREQLQRHTWQHGCGELLPDGSRPCHKKRGCDCPQRYGGGLKLTGVKSAAGGRVLMLDPITTEALRAHRRSQDEERREARNLWYDLDFVFTQANGRPIDPRKDYEEWRRLLRAAGVREARLHDARHTAATILLVQGVDARTVMEVMGWSTVAMLARYQHVIDELRSEAAARVGTWLYAGPPSEG